MIWVRRTAHLSRITSEQVKLLRRLTLNDENVMAEALTGHVDEFQCLDSRTKALLRIAALVSVAPDSTSFPWAVDLALAAGVDDEQVFQALIVVAPIVGQARMSASLPHLMDALELEVLEG